MNDEQMADLLNFDPLDYAGRVTGVDYKEDKFTEALGVSLHVNHADIKRAALTAADDSTFSESLENYVRIIEAEGFERVLAVPFDGQKWHDDPAPSEHYFIYFKPSEGVLLAFDTWGGDKVNSGKFYYNWAPSFDPDGPARRLRLTSSGSYSKTDDGAWLWAGDHDCREAIRFHMRQLRTHGSFVTPWTREPFLWLLHYMDHKIPGYDHRAITAGRLALLPGEVRQAVGAVGQR